MELKDRKRIKNGLPGYVGGTSAPVLYNGQYNNFTNWLNYLQQQNQTVWLQLSNAPKDGWNGNFILPSNNNINYKEYSGNPYEKSGPLSPEVYRGANNNGWNTESNRTQASSVAGAGPWFAIGEWLGTGVLSGYNSIKRRDEILANEGRSQANIGGFSYERQNEADVKKRMNEYNNEMKLSWLTNPGKGLTMFFGRHKQRLELQSANRRARSMNRMGASSAESDYLNQQYALLYGNTEDQLLYAKHGKDTVESSVGKIPANATAKVAKGEPIMDNLDDVSTATAHVVRNGKRGIDTEYANVNDYTRILGGDYIAGTKLKYQDAGLKPALTLEAINKYEKRPNNVNAKLRGSVGRSTDELQSETLRPIKEKAVNELRLLADMLATQHQLEGYNNQIKAKKGKDNLPKFALGSNWWVDGLGAAIGLGLSLSAVLQKPKRPDSYRINPYENAALSQLASLRVNPYPIMGQLRDQERRNLYAINRAGGLSGSQKAFANVATGIGTLRSIADLGLKTQEQNNMYKSNYASTLLNAGQANRQARMAANQYDLDYYSKAHAAKLQMFEQGLYNLLLALQQGYANQFKKNTYDDTMDLYRQQVDNNAYNIRRSRRIYS